MNRKLKEAVRGYARDAANPDTSAVHRQWCIERLQFIAATIEDYEHETEWAEFVNEQLAIATRQENPA